MEDLGPKSWVMPRNSNFVVYEALGHNHNNKVQDLICYCDFSHSNSHETQTSKKNDNNSAKEQPKFNTKKRKSTSGLLSSSSWKCSWSSFSSSGPEVQRKKRVAAYNAYASEGKVKGSLKKSFAWLKGRYTKTVYGFW